MYTILGRNSEEMTMLIAGNGWKQKKASENCWKTLRIIRMSASTTY